MPGLDNVSGRPGARLTAGLSFGFALILAMVPVLWWFVLALNDGLTANPPQYLILSSGEWALAGLCLVVAAGAIQRWLGMTWLVRHRRLFALFTFFYTSLHLLGWAFWEQGFSVSAMASDIVTRQFVLIGCLAFLLMLPLALTSTQGWMRRLGRRWKRLHDLVYPVLVLSVWHFWLVRVGKNDFSDVRVYLGVVLVLACLKLYGYARKRKRVG